MIIKTFLPATRLLLARRPFYARLLASLTKVEEPGLSLPVVLVWGDGQPVLRYQKQLLHLLGQRPDYSADWLEECLLHLLLGHHAASQKYADPQLTALAADLEMEQFHSQYDQEGVFRKLRQRLHLPPFFDLQTAYRQLSQLQQTVDRQALLPGIDRLPLSRKAHWHWHEQSAHWEDYLRWQASIRTSLPSLEQVADTPWAVLINRLDRSRGAWEVPWPVLLRRFALTGQRDQVYSSRQRPSKRYQRFPGTRRRRSASLVVILDTSGSISHDQRMQFFRELQQLQSQLHQVDLIEADNQVRQFYPFTGELPAFSQGGGATNFDPALALVNEQLYYDGIIYFTDGEGPVPTVRPRFPILWLMATENKIELPVDQFPGQVVELKR